MTRTALVDVSLEEASNGDDDTEDSDTPTGRIKAAVSDQNDQVLEATVEISGADGTTDTKETGSMTGLASFPDVPVQEYTVTISADGYQTKTVDVAPEDFTA